MEKKVITSNNNGINYSNSMNRTGGDVSSGFVLQWGNRKRLRCMKVQAKDKDDSAAKVLRTTPRRVVKADKDSMNQSRTTSNTNHSNRCLNLRQRLPSPRSPAPSPPRVLRNFETSSAMRGHGGTYEKKGINSNSYYDNNNNKSAATSDTAQDGNKGGSSLGSGEAAAATIWPPKFEIGLTYKEKEEDFMAIKGSKLPQRPKKRAKVIQRTLNLVSPGAWLCDLTLERYEVREKKISKKRSRGLKAIGNTELESE